VSVRLEDLAAVVTLGLACWVLRTMFVLIVPADRLPITVAQALQHLAPAALSSIIAVELITVVDPSDPTSTLESVGVVLAAGAVATLTRSMTWTVLSGVVAVLAVDLASLG
jgi:branched-subunit amino acid transport protein